MFSHFGSMHGAAAGAPEVTPDAVSISPTGGPYVEYHATDRIGQCHGLSACDDLLAMGHELFCEGLVEIEVSLRCATR